MGCHGLVCLDNSLVSSGSYCQMDLILLCLPGTEPWQGIKSSPGDKVGEHPYQELSPEGELRVLQGAKWGNMLGQGAMKEGDPDLASHCCYGIKRLLVKFETWCQVIRCSFFVCDDCKLICRWLKVDTCSSGGIPIRAEHLFKSIGIAITINGLPWV